MAREKNPYLRQFDEKIWDNEVLKENKDLAKDFINYCKSVDRSPETIKQYESTLKWLFCYIYKEFNNKSFIKINKRDIMNMQNYWLNDVELSSSRIRFIKSTMSSMSNFIENILDEDYPDFRNIINKIPAPTKTAVMEKTIVSQNDVDSLLNKLIEKNMIQHAFYIALLAYSGVRKAESLQIKIDMFRDDNIVKDKLWITPEIRCKGAGRAGKMLAKNVLVEKFKPYLELWKTEREKLGVDIIDALVIKKEDGWKKATIQTINSWVASIENIIGYRLYSHMFRHRYVTALLESGVPNDVVKDLVGWSNISMCDIYDDRTKESKFDEHLDKL